MVGYIKIKNFKEKFTIKDEYNILTMTIVDGYINDDISIFEIEYDNKIFMRLKKINKLLGTKHHQEEIEILDYINLIKEDIINDFKGINVNNHEEYYKLNIKYK